ncbi:MAG: four helix bundle protein [bacterium]
MAEVFIMNMPGEILSTKSEILNHRLWRDPAPRDKSQDLNIKQRHYDLEERTLIFAQKIMLYVQKLPKKIANIEVGKQLIRSGGSVGANYIEANESLGRRDFLMRIKISKKEAKESRYWLVLSEPDITDEKCLSDKNDLIQESTELMKIFGSILDKSK